MILASRPPDVPTPSSFQTLDEDLVIFLQRPYDEHAAAGDGFPTATPGPNNPETRDRLLTYAYVVYDTFVTRQLPPRSIPPDHAALLLPLLELLHGLYPYDSSTALLLGCVYHYHDLIQRSLQINRHILRHDPHNVSAMCNLGANLHRMDLPVQAFECWWKALQLSSINWDILDNMLETFLGSNHASPGVFNNSNTPQILQIHQQALKVCNFVMGHLPENPVGLEEVHRAQKIFCLRALLLRSLQEAGEWEDLVDGIEIGINTTLTPPSLPAGSTRPGRATFDDLLLQVHCVGTSICDDTDPGVTSHDSFLNTPDSTSSAAAVKQEGFGILQPGVSRQKVLQPMLLLLPEEALRLPLMLWPSTHGSLPSIAISTAPGNSRDDVWMERVEALTNATTSRLLRTWATRVQDSLEAQPSTSRDHTVSTPVPCSIFQATQSLVILAEYLALALSPTAVSYNDLGILLSSFDSQPGDSRSSMSSPPDKTTGHSLSRVYFEAGLEVDPHNAHLLANLGSYWKKEKKYEEAIRYYQLALARNPEIIAARVYLECTLKEIESDFNGVRNNPTYQKFD